MADATSAATNPYSDNAANANDNASAANARTANAEALVEAFLTAVHNTRTNQLRIHIVPTSAAGGDVDGASKGAAREFDFYVHKHHKAEFEEILQWIRDNADTIESVQITPESSSAASTAAAKQQHVLKSLLNAGQSPQKFATETMDCIMCHCCAIPRTPHCHMCHPNSEPYWAFVKENQENHDKAVAAGEILVARYHAWLAANPVLQNSDSDQYGPFIAENQSKYNKAVQAREHIITRYHAWLKANPFLEGERDDLQNGILTALKQGRSIDTLRAECEKLVNLQTVCRQRAAKVFDFEAKIYGANENIAKYGLYRYPVHLKVLTVLEDELEKIVQEQRVQRSKTGYSWGASPATAAAAAAAAATQRERERDIHKA